MKKGVLKVDWSVADSEEAWQQSQIVSQRAAPVLAGAAKSAIRQEQILAILLVGIVLSLVGNWAWKLHSMPSSEDGREADSGSNGANAIAVEAPPNQQEQPQDSIMWSAVNLPPLEPPQTLTMVHFKFHYRALDVHAAYEVAPKVEELYSKLRHDFDLSLTDASAIYTIEIVTNGAEFPYSIDFLNHRIIVPSPTLLPVPVEMTATAVLYQSVTYPIARLVLFDSIEKYQPQRKSGFEKWAAIPRILPLWAVWEDGGPLATGRGEIVRWIYANAQSENQSENQSEQKYQQLRDSYDHICQRYHIWGISPSDLFIPVSSIETDRDSHKARHFPTLPESIQNQLYPQQWTGTLASAFDGVMFGTIIDYIVLTYGRRQLPGFVAALGDYPNVETLIPAVFAVSAEEFEAGWQAYLVQHYQVQRFSELYNQ